MAFKLHLVLALVVAFLVCFTHARVHYYDFVLKETNFTRLCLTKSILTVNDSFPGPTIRAQTGDTVFVTVYNQGHYGVTIHWHGVKQPRNPWPDGPEYVTQCPIAVGSNFTQEISLSDEEGTLWWHAHSDWTRATVHGAIVVHPANGTQYPYAQPDGEELIVLGEWYKGDVMEIIETATATGGDPNLSDAYTINGLVGDQYNCSTDAIYKLTVDYGKTYLLRIISAIMNEEQFFGIANHTMTVVGSDGAYLKPITVDYIMITPGQTMDVLVTANKEPSYYYMATSPFIDANAPADLTSTTGIVAYSGNYTPPSTPPFPSLPNDSDKEAATNFAAKLRSLNSKEHPSTVPQTVTKNILITVSVNEILCDNCSGPDGNRLAASLSNTSFASPSIDILQAYYGNISGVFTPDFPKIPPYPFNFTGDVGNNTLYPFVGTQAKVIKYNESVEIVLQGTNVVEAENHPMHLHGYSFYVVGMDFGNFDPDNSPKNYNLVDPPLVNTFGVPKNGWIAVRFVADNPGVWFMHCHLERHASWGMATVLIVQDGPTNETSMRPPPSYMPPCSTT